MKQQVSQSPDGKNPKSKGEPSTGTKPERGAERVAGVPAGDDGVISRVRDLWRGLQRNRWSRWAVDLLLVGLVLTVVSSFQTRSLLKAGQSAPEIQLMDLNGERFSLEDFRGKPVLLAFWAPWCGACKLESPNLSRLQRWVGERATVLSVALDYSDRASVERYVSEQKVDYPVLLGSGRQSEDYKLKGFPTVYFVNSKGEIKRAAMGYTTTLGLWWRLML